MIEYTITVDWSEKIKRYILYTMAPMAEPTIIIIDICIEENLIERMKYWNDRGFNPTTGKETGCRPLYKIRRRNETRFDEITEKTYKMVWNANKNKK